jgi:serine phosphatase RsbU (regulator of sigma subunit)
MLLVEESSQGPIRIRDLVGHREAVEGDTPLEAVHKRFAETGRDFMAVLDGARLTGVCARREIATQLGARFGFALFARRPVREHLTPTALRIDEGMGLRTVLESVAARPEALFYDDVILVDSGGAFLGFIYVHALVRLQTRLLVDNISELEASRRQIAEKNQAMEDDLLMAREVQLAMLPGGEGTAGGAGCWSFHSHYEPAGGVSGDFFHVLPISDSEAGVLVCDVMGHGVRSALVTAMLRAFIADLRPLAREPGALLTRLNRELTQILAHAGTLLFVTAAYAQVDTGAGRVSYAQAGHPTGYVRRAGGRVDRLPMNDDLAGPALGLIPDFEYASASGEIAPGDSAVLFTDGLTEARAPSGEEWGEERLLSGISGRAAEEPGRLLKAIVASASDFTGGRGFEDDVCVVCLTSLAPRPAGPFRVAEG